MKNIIFAVCVFACAALHSYADITVSDVKVFSGYPWKEVVVGYTITGTAVETDIIKLTATDKSANKTYTAQSLTDAVLTKGRHVLRWNAAAEGAKFSSANVVFSVSVVDPGGVQLWANGPYWAECNVGATKPEEYGYYFWWGDTVGYKDFKDSIYGWTLGWVSVSDGRSFSFKSGNCPTYGMSKSQLQTAGYIDAAGNLVAAHDAATAHLGAPWRMPTDAEFSALISNCTTTWTTRNGVSGRLVSGKGEYASRSIFFPAAGYIEGDELKYLGTFGKYWSSLPSSDRSDCAGLLDISSSGCGTASSFRWAGRSVRPVRRLAK